MLKKSLRTPLTALFTSVLALVLVAGDWPQWRGPHGTGVANETGVPLKWSKTENIRWRAALDGPGNSTPIVIGQRVYVTHAPAKSNARGILCFDRNTGEVLWKHFTEYAEAEPTHQTNPFVSSSPVSDGKRVVAWYGSAGVFCYDLDGNVLWQRDLGKVEHIWGYGSSPVIYEGLILLNYGPGLNAFVVALTLDEGEEVWRKESPGQKASSPNEFRGSWSTPVLFQDGSRIVALLSLPEALRAVDPKNGGEIWACGGLGKLVYTSPLVAGDVVISMSGYGGPALAVKGGGSGDVTDTHRLWLHDMKHPQRVGSGVVVDDHIYILNDNGIAYCIDVKTGARKWDQRIGSGGSWSSMVFVDGRIYVPNTAGTTLVLEPNPAECKLLAENPVGETTRGSLAVSNGQVFLRTHQALYCIQEGAGK